MKRIRHLLQLLRDSDPERGAISLFVATVATALLLGVGLIYDGSLKIAAARDATSIASEAARAAGQELTGEAILGHSSSVDPSRGVIAARTYLAAVGADGTVAVNGTDITVTANATWAPRFFGLFGAGNQVETGTASASTKRVLGGTEQ